MMRLTWRNGSVHAAQGAVFLSATRFTYQRLRDMPGVFWHGLGLRKRWPEVPGTVGVFLAGDLLACTTYTVSAWGSEGDLQRWLGSPEHVRLMRAYKGRMHSSCAVSWNVESFSRRAIFKEGMRRLAEKDQRTP